MKSPSSQVSNAGRICITIGVLVLTGVSGCTLETSVQLLPEDQGTVDPGFVGDWRAPNPYDSGVYRLQIRNLDDQRYIFGSSWEGSDDYTLNSTALVNIAGAIFAQVRTLDLSPTSKYKYFRVALLYEDMFTFRALNSGFFSGDREFTNSAELRNVIATHIDNPEMYSNKVWIATRIEY